MSKVIVTHHESLTYIAVLDDFDRLIACDLSSDEGLSKVGHIYLGRIMKKQKGISAYFVDYGDDKDGYLSYKDANNTLSPGQTVMVQIAKDPFLEKGAKLSLYPSFSSETLVLVTDSDHIHFSSKIPKDSKTTEMKKALKTFQRESEAKVGFIVRTNAYELELEALLKEADYLLKLHRHIQEIKDYRPVKTCLYEPEHEWLSLFKDLNKKEVTTVYVDDSKRHEQINQYYEHIHDKNFTIDLVTDSLYRKYDISNKLNRFLQRKVWLSSGASLIIDRTEAMYVIDVNSDKNVQKRQVQKNLLKINLEAAKEIARQMRVRNMSGIIIIDFIDLASREQEKELIEAMQNYVFEDPIPTSIHGITKLGLMEITRKRMRPSLVEVLEKA